MSALAAPSCLQSVPLDWIAGELVDGVISGSGRTKEFRDLHFNEGVKMDNFVAPYTRSIKHPDVILKLSGDLRLVGAPAMRSMILIEWTLLLPNSMKGKISIFRPRSAQSDTITIFPRPSPQSQPERVSFDRAEIIDTAARPVKNTAPAFELSIEYLRDVA
ncbi:hypothetical protein BJY01DRAFT_250543 [Aspergillus pseudoustus]|uniref:Uncharacterized protein n=1 Tax=Aspergillus pseudoustus TaxID=1810923 RepID=A0ABR4JH50_9EURO